MADTASAVSGMLAGWRRVSEEERCRGEEKKNKRTKPGEQNHIKKGPKIEAYRDRAEGLNDKHFLGGSCEKERDESGNWNFPKRGKALIQSKAQQVLWEVDWRSYAANTAAVTFNSQRLHAPSHSTM